MDQAIRVPYHRPSIGAEEIQEVIDTLQSGWLTTGPKTARFEQAVKEYVGAPHAQAVNSCTAGLHLSLAALGIGPGDEVITTPLTFCATVNVIVHAGAKPVLADVGPDGNIDPASVASRITSKTRAIIPVHFAGLPCEMSAIWNLAARRDLCVIEDCAHAIGAHYRGVPIGGADPVSGLYSDAAVFSFYATKNLTTGEGGMVTAHDSRTIDTVRTLTLHGINKAAWNRYSDKGSWYYEVMRPGWKYNLTDLASSIGIHQLGKLEGFIATRTRLARLYNELLEDCAEVEAPADKEDCRHAWHLYTLRLKLDKLSITRDEFIQQLRARGVGTSVHFIPIPLHPAYSEVAARPENRVPRAIDLYKRMISLPLYPGMTESDVALVVEAVKEIAMCGRKKRLAVASGVI